MVAALVASKYTKNYPFHGRILTLLQHLDTVKYYKVGAL